MLEAVRRGRVNFDALDQPGNGTRIRLCFYGKRASNIKVLPSKANLFTLPDTRKGKVDPAEGPGGGHGRRQSDDQARSHGLTRGAMCPALRPLSSASSSMLVNVALRNWCF